MATIVITPSLTGYASITNFLLSSDAVHTFASNTSGTEWSLGNGTIVRTLSDAIYQTYDSPGIYKVNLLNSIETSALTVLNYLPESLSFEAITTTAMPGASTALVLNLTSNYAGPHDVTLYAVNSNSFPYNENGGLWTHLNPQWR